MTPVGAYGPTFVAELAPGLRYVPSSTHFETNPNGSGMVGQGFTTAGAIAEPTLTTADGHQVLSWAPETESGKLVNGGASWATPPPLTDPDSGQTTYWWGYDDYPQYFLRFKVRSDPSYPFVDGAPILSSELSWKRTLPLR